MKRLFNLVIVIVLMSVVGALAAEKVINIQTNLHCGSCKNKIEKALKKTKGVISTSADVDTKIVMVKYDDKIVDDKKIVSTISDLGYEAELIVEQPVRKK